MTRDQVNYIIDNKTFPYPTDGIKLIETHISWVILTDQYVYKIKKPIEFSFLNFSTLEKSNSLFLFPKAALAKFG